MTAAPVSPESRFRQARLLVGKDEGKRGAGGHGLAPDVAGGFLRISFGPDTSDVEVDAFLAEWARIASRARAA